MHKGFIIQISVAKEFCILFSCLFGKYITAMVYFSKLRSIKCCGIFLAKKGNNNKYLDCWIKCVFL